MALTANTAGDLGGFECVPDFHKEFDSYFAAKFESKEMKPQPVHSEFTSLPDTVHGTLHKRIKSILYPAGSGIFWDWRLPHKNATDHNGALPREVVYSGYLPVVPLNIEYAEQQVRHYVHGADPPDFNPLFRYVKLSDLWQAVETFEFSALGRQLVGIDRFAKAIDEERKSKLQYEQRKQEEKGKDKQEEKGKVKQQASCVLL